MASGWKRRWTVREEEPRTNGVNKSRRFDEERIRIGGRKAGDIEKSWESGEKNGTEYDQDE